MIHQSMAAHFEDGVPWSKTAFYQEAVAGMAAGKPRHQYIKDLEYFEENLRAIDKLYERIRVEGFKPQREIAREPFWQVVSDSILVDIGRDGELLFVEGRRRLSIAKLLDVDRVPVMIRYRHPEWMDVCRRASSCREEVLAG